MIALILSALLVATLPNSEAFLSWKTNTSYVTAAMEVPVEAVVSVSCEKNELFPTHPQQTLKEYHAFQSGEYDAFRLRGSDPACRLSSVGRDRQGRPRCSLADTLQLVVMSDTYRDACGNFYRGFKKVMYFAKDENMGTLFSPGHTAYARADSTYALELSAGHTYSLKPDDFEFLTDLFPGDREKIDVNLRDAKATHTYDAQTFLFTEIR